MGGDRRGFGFVELGRAALIDAHHFRGGERAAVDAQLIDVSSPRCRSRYYTRLIVLGEPMASIFVVVATETPLA